MTKSLRQCSLSIGSIFMIAHASGASALAGEAVLNPSDKGFIEKFNQVKCDKERADAVDLKERI